MSDTLEPRALDLQHLLDRAALERLVLSYCHGIDRSDLKLVRSLYHDDAVDDHGAMFCGSPDEYVAWLPGMLANWQATRHTVSNMLFLIEGDTAEGEHPTTAWHRTADGTRDLIAHGRYLDRYERRDGVWKFLRRNLVLDWMEERANAPTLGGGVDDGVELGRGGADDPVYARLGLFGADRKRRNT